MRPETKAALLLASAALAAGCYVKVEDQSVAVTKASICPGGACPPLTSTGGALVIQVDLDLGGADFLQPSTDVGPVTLNNSLNLLHVEYFWQKVALGVVILLASMLDSALRRLG